MGTWDTGFFDDDQAMDWSFQLLRSYWPRYLPAILKEVRDEFAKTAEGELVDSLYGACGVAAAAVVASMAGINVDLPAHLRIWRRLQVWRPSKKLHLDARDVCELCYGSKSELSALWSDASAGVEWRNKISELMNELTRKIESRRL